VLANKSFNVNKLMRLLKTKQGSLADRAAQFFMTKAETVKETTLDSCDLTGKKC
jgi:hypothetical protein